MTKKSLRHTPDSQHGNGATCDAAGDDPRTDQESPRLLPSTFRYQVSLVVEEDAETVGEDTDGTDEDNIVGTATTPTADRHRIRSLFLPSCARQVCLEQRCVKTRSSQGLETLGASVNSVSSKSVSMTEVHI